MAGQRTGADGGGARSEIQYRSPIHQVLGVEWLPIYAVSASGALDDRHGGRLTPAAQLRTRAIDYLNCVRMTTRVNNVDHLKRSVAYSPVTSRDFPLCPGKATSTSRRAISQGAVLLRIPIPASVASSSGPQRTGKCVKNTTQSRRFDEGEHEPQL